MVRTTRAPSIDVAAVFPELAALTTQTVRLHPRPGPEPPANASKFGGSILWPADEPWPLCTEEEWRRADDTTPPHDHRYIPVLQLRRDDFPELPFPDNTDLFQLLWCPNDHEVTLSPVCKVFWRSETDIINPCLTMPAPEPIEPDYLPRPCCLHPERVTEYPGWYDMTESLRERIEQVGWEAWETGAYEYDLSVAPGTKVGGYVDWIQGDNSVICNCGRMMDHLLTIDSWEFTGAWERWCPVEDIEATGKTIAELATENTWPDALDTIRRSTGVMLGDAGRLYLFICHSCPDWPIWWVMQYS